MNNEEDNNNLAEQRQWWCWRTGCVEWSLVHQASSLWGKGAMDFSVFKVYIGRLEDMSVNGLTSPNVGNIRPNESKY